LLVKRDGKPSKKIDEAKEKNMEIVFLDDFVKEHHFELGEHKPRGRPAGAGKKVVVDEAPGARERCCCWSCFIVDDAIKQLKATLAELEKLRLELA
jgi:hypothetical protein